MTMNTPFRKFNRLLIGSVIAALLALGGFNYVIDPYSVWAVPKVPEFNQLKPRGDAENRLRVMHEIRKHKPHALIFGTSTSKQLPADDFESLVNRQACNAGMVMASPAEIDAVLELAIHEQPDLDTVFLALDFLQFNQRSGVASKTYEPPTWPVPVSNPGLALLFSRAGLEASAESLRANLASSGAPDVLADRSAAFDKYLEEIVLEGTTYLPYEISETAFSDLARIVERCERQGIRLQVAISPMHAVHIRTLQDAGLGDEYEEWIRRVVAIVPVWDFSTANGVTNEAVGPTMEYYTDPLHYSVATGALMLRRVYGTGAPSDFGVRVTEETVDAHLSGNQ